MVGNQIASLTPGPSFDHNLCCRCLNGSCEAIFDIYTSKPFQNIENTSRWGVLTPTIKLWSLRSLEGLQVPTFGSASFIFTLASKWGCDIPSPHLRAPTRPFTLKVLQAREHNTTPSPSVVFTFGLVVESIKELGCITLVGSL